VIQQTRLNVEALTVGENLAVQLVLNFVVQVLVVPARFEYRFRIGHPLDPQVFVDGAHHFARRRGMAGQGFRSFDWELVSHPK
jgi:hypothetical protein